MTGSIYMIDENGSLQAMNEREYATEDILQSLLQDYPNLLAGNQVDPEDPRKWLLISREVGIPFEEGGGEWLSLDHLFLDQEGIPTFIEVKRSSDTRIRREVVGQMLDYAANAVANWPPGKIQSLFEDLCLKNDEDPAQILADYLNQDLNNITARETYWDRVSTNLRAGRIRLVFVADEIPLSLQTIIEFLNNQLDPAEVLGLEIKQYIGNNVKTLVPNVIGVTAKSSGKKQSVKWDYDSFINKLRENKGEQISQLATTIIDWSKENLPADWWGEGSRNGSYIPGIDHKGEWHQTVGLWTNGNIEIQFQYMKNDPPFDQKDLRIDYLNMWNSIEGVNLPPDSIDRRPSLPMEIFLEDDKLEQLLSILDWFKSTVEST